VESLYETWERFKEMLRKCMHHILEVWQQVSIFYNGLFISTRQILDSNSGGILGNRRPSEIFDKIKEIAQTSFQWHTPRNAKMKTPGIYHVDESTSLQGQIEALTAKIKKLETGKATAKVMACGGCGEPHENWSYMADERESTNFINNRNPGMFENNYNQEWKRHPNFSWKDQNNSQQPLVSIKETTTPSPKETIKGKTMENLI
jgi:hypothetical protein